MTCAVEGCERTDIKGVYGYCHKHYERWRRNGHPTISGYDLRNGSVERPVVTEKECKTCRQVKPLSEYYKRGTWVYTQCKKCHNNQMNALRLKQRLDNPPGPRTYVDHGECAFDGCHNTAHVQLKNAGGPDGWYCKSHRQQWHVQRELVPLRQYEDSYINDKFRRCTKCEDIKPHEQFHTRKGGKGRQSACKECQLLISRFNYLIKQDRFDEATGVLVTMPPKMKPAYAQRLLDAQK